MASPLGLTIKNNLIDMQIGDCIPCRYTTLTSGVAGIFSELGTCTATEIPLNGTATPDGLFYLIKTNKGMLIADRVIQHSISWDTLNSAKYIEGKSITIGTDNILIRCLLGGCAYLDVDGKKSNTDKSLGLAFPSINEYDKYIRLATLNNKITKEDDNVWHWSNLYNWCKDTIVIPIGTSDKRVYRGKSITANFLNIASNTINTTIGFRPVINYIESDIQSEVIY